MARYNIMLCAAFGPGQPGDESVRALNRIVTWAENGLKFGAGQRRAELILESWNWYA